jgi:hypothetical protein
MNVLQQVPHTNTTCSKFHVITIHMFVAACNAALSRILITKLRLILIIMPLALPLPTAAVKIDST